MGQAIALVHEHSVQSGRTETVGLSDLSNGCVLSKDVLSPIDMPPFRQAAMDGYALRLHDTVAYTIVGEIRAGDGKHPVLQLGEAVRIFTGAPVPDTADAVIMQESVRVEKRILKVEKPVSAGENIRPLGAQVKKGEIALSRGTKLSPAGIGFLASLGIAKIPVFKKPAVAIVSTGDELIESHQRLTRGKIYESNSPMLLRALTNLGYSDVPVFKVGDDAQKTRDVLDGVIREREVVLITGGISVGDCDFVGKALRALGVETVFYKVRQKPGKPLLFGKKGSTLVFALPGNPASALTCFYIYACPALRKMAGETDFQLGKTIKRSASSFVKKVGRAQFLKAVCQGDEVRILQGQSSAVLQSFASANALVYMPETASEIKPNAGVEVIVLPI